MVTRFEHCQEKVVTIPNLVMKRAWLRPYKAPCIVESGSYVFTTVCGPEYMSLDTYIIFLKKCKNRPFKGVFVTFYLEHSSMLMFSRI